MCVPEASLAGLAPLRGKMTSVGSLFGRHEPCYAVRVPESGRLACRGRVLRPLRRMISPPPPHTRSPRPPLPASLHPSVPNRAPQRTRDGDSASDVGQAHQPRDRRRIVPVGEHDQVVRAQHLRQARGCQPPRSGRPRSGARAPSYQSRLAARWAIASRGTVKSFVPHATATVSRIGSSKRSELRATKTFTMAASLATTNDRAGGAPNATSAFR